MRFIISTTTEFHEKLKAKANAAGMGVSEYVRFAINMLWANEK